MPGFTLIYQHNGLSESVKGRASRLVDASFKIDYISKTDKLLLLFRDGNHYPYEIIDTEQFIAIVEGKIYDLIDYNDQTFRNHLLKTYKSEYIDESLNYFQGLDGEFIIYILDKKGKKHTVINDYLGRLPAYVYHGTQFILSRDIFVLDKVTTGLMFDEQSVYQFIRLGFPLGKQTLFQDIERFPPSAILSVNEEQIKIDSFPLNLSELKDSYTDSKPEEALYEIFADAIRNRIKKEKKVVLSLSGGLDSRVIMGEIVKNNYHVDYATFNYENAIIENDVRVVKQLAKLYDKTPQYIELKEWAPEFFDELASVKGGMNYVGMSFIIEFLKQLGTTHNLMLTGDGGDKTLPCLFPDKSIKNNKLAKHILKSNRNIKAIHADDFVTFDVAAYEKELQNYLKTMPGENTKMKYKSFLVFERAKNWLFEGEDRNRNYIWSTSPFYHPAFFKLAHSIPEKAKKDFSLFRKFINLVDPELNKLDNANWGIPLGDEKKLKRMLFKQKIKSHIPFRIKRFSQQSELHEQLVWEVSSLLNKGFGGQVLMNAHPNDLRSLTSETLFHLLTVLKVSEMSWREL